MYFSEQQGVACTIWRYLYSVIPRPGQTVTLHLGIHGTNRFSMASS